MAKNSAEKRERMYKPCATQRFRFMRDDDGHDYIIPADEEAQFRRWLACGPYWEGYEGYDYNDCAIGCSPSCYTFTDPQETK